MWRGSMLKLCQNLTYLELEHEFDLRLKKFYKHRPWAWTAIFHVAHEAEFDSENVLTVNVMWTLFCLNSSY